MGERLERVDTGIELRVQRAMARVIMVARIV